MNTPIKSIGKYKIEKMLGSGTMGTVYLGYAPMLDQPRAIKVMKTGVEDDELRKRFFREAQSAAKLDHPNIIRVLDLDVDANNHPFIVMEYVEGEDLKTFIDQKRFISFEQKLKIIKDVCAGLEHAHEKGVIHRDIKPGNIRINRNWDAKILDFGLARLESADASRASGVLGSPYYMSPEQWKGQSDLDRRSDLFSVSAVLYELITYIRPFEADGITAVMARIVLEPHIPLRGNLPACASELSGILDRGLAKEREKRFATCIAFSRALSDFSSGLPSFRDEVNVKVDQIEAELERLKQRSEQLHILEFFESASLESGAPGIDESSFLDSIGPEEKKDYGVLLQRHAELQAKLDSHNKRFNAALPLLRLLRTAHSQYQQRQFEACQETLQELLAASPANPSGLRLLAACQKSIADRKSEEEKQVLIQGLLLEAQQARTRGQLKSALASVRKVLEISPTHPEANSLYDEIRQSAEATAKEKMKRVVKLLEACRTSLLTREYDAACAASEEILELSSAED